MAGIEAFGIETGLYHPGKSVAELRIAALNLLQAHDQALGQSGLKEH